MLSVSITLSTARRVLAPIAENIELITVRASFALRTERSNVNTSLFKAS